MRACFRRTRSLRDALPMLRPLAAWGLGLLLAACSGGGEQPPASAGASSAPAAGASGSTPAAAPAAGEVRTVRISQGSDLLSMDPYYKLESPSLSIQRNIYEPLIDYGRDFKLEPVLAERWEHTDATHWTIHLRRGVSFQNGEAFDAGDVVFSLRRALDWPPSRVAAEIQTVKRVTATTSYTVTIETHVPDAVLPRRLASILMLDRETVSANGDQWLATNGVGTGPYRVESWSKDNPCVLVANPGWWGGKVPVERAMFLPSSVDTTRMAALQRGDLDIMLNVPPRYVDQAARVSGVRIEKAPGMRLIYLGLDCGREKTPGIAGSPPNPLMDVRVRRAMLLAIDNQLIVRTILGGNAEPADQLFPPNVIGHIPGFTLGKRPDLEAARRLLTEAGYPQGFSVRLDGPNDRYVNDAAILQAVAGQLAHVGIKVEVNARPKAQFFAGEEKGEGSFFLIGWANTNGDGFGTFDHLLHTPDPARKLGKANSTTNYHNAKVDALCEQASAEFDEAKRAALLQEAHRIVLEELPHLPLHYQTDIHAASQRIDWHPRPSGHIYLTDITWKP